MQWGTPYPSNVDNTEFEGAVKIFKPMVTPADVLKFGLVGVPKVFPLTGEHISTEYVANHLEAAICELEMQGLILSPKIFPHIDDWHVGMTQRYFPILVNKFPVTAVESILLTFPNATTNSPSLTYSIPESWITWERNKINIIATTGVLIPRITGGGSHIPVMHWSNAAYKPSAFRATYQAGFENDKLPTNVWQLVVDMAAYSVLVEIGPMLFPNSNISVGIDGVNQSSSLPGPRIFVDRIKMLEAKIQKSRAVIIGYYGQTINMNFAGL